MLKKIANYFLSLFIIFAAVIYSQEESFDFDNAFSTHFSSISSNNSNLKIEKKSGNHSNKRVLKLLIADEENGDTENLVEFFSYENKTNFYFLKVTNYLCSNFQNFNSNTYLLTVPIYILLSNFRI